MPLKVEPKDLLQGQAKAKNIPKEVKIAEDQETGIIQEERKIGEMLRIIPWIAPNPPERKTKVLNAVKPKKHLNPDLQDTVEARVQLLPSAIDSLSKLIVPSD